MTEIILSAIAANTLVLAVLAFLSKSIITHWLNKDVKEFETKLRHTAELNIAEYQSRLEKEKLRLQISYGGIFEQQAKVILKLFELMTELQVTIELAIYAKDEKDPEYVEFMGNWKEYSKYYTRNKILLPESLEKPFDKLMTDAYWSVYKYRRAEKQIARDGRSEAEYEKLFDRQEEAQKVIDQIPNLKDQLTKSLRSLIGVGEHMLQGDP